MFGNKTVAKQNRIRFPLMVFKYYLSRYNRFDQKCHAYIYPSLNPKVQYGAFMYNEYVL